MNARTMSDPVTLRTTASILTCLLLLGIVTIGDEPQKEKPEIDSKTSTESQDDVTVTLEWPETPLYVGDRIYAKLKIENKRVESLSHRFAPASEYMFLECLQDGKPVPLTRYGEKEYNAKRADIQGGGIPPMYTQESEVDVSRIYDLSLEGEYVIRQQLSLWLRYDAKSPTRIKPIGPKEISLKIKLKARPKH